VGPEEPAGHAADGGELDLDLRVLPGGRDRSTGPAASPEIVRRLDRHAAFEEVREAARLIGGRIDRSLIAAVREVVLLYPDVDHGPFDRRAGAVDHGD